MIRSSLAITLFVSFSLLGGCADQRPNYPGLSVVKDLPLPGGTNRFDYQSHDVAARRLYIAHMGSHALVVVDTDENEVVAYVREIGRPTGVLAVPELGRVYISDSLHDQLVVVDQETNAIVARIPTGELPDGLAYDPKSKRLSVSDEAGCSNTVIDARTNEVVATIEIGGEAGNTQYDAVSGLMYVNVQTRDQLVALDPETATIVGRYDLEGSSHNHGLAILADQRLAMISCKGQPRMLVFDIEAKKVVGSEEIGRGADVLAYDAETHQLYVAAESGPVTVFSVKNKELRRLGMVDVDPRAHTVSIDPRSHLLYVPLENVGGRPVLRICKPLEPDS